jgi:hypothetical protein
MKMLKTIKHEMLEILPPAIFFFIAFTLILVTKRLILSEYGISWTGFGSAVIGAYLIGKVVLIVDKLPFVNRFPDRQLIYNASWKCLIYFLAADLFQYLERTVPFWLKHGSLVEANRHFVTDTVWPHFWLIQMWLVVLFFVYCAMRELVRAIGRDKVIHMFFGGRKDADSLYPR